MDLACAQPIHAGALAAHTVPQIARPASYTGNLQITPRPPRPETFVPGEWPCQEGQCL